MAQREKKDLNLYQGDDRSYKFTLTMGGAAWNITGATSVRLAVKQDISDTAELFAVTVISQAAGNDWANGIVVVSIPEVLSKLLKGDGVYDLQIILAGKRSTVCYGSVILQKQIGD